jgi:putative peptidoglycan lipid II flippase
MQLSLGNASGMAVGTLLSRITGVIRDIALVAAIGTGIFSDTYSVANSIPNIIYILVAGGAINAVFIPALVRHMNDDEDQGKQFTDQLLTVVSAFLIGIVIITMLGAGLLIRLYATSNWSATDLHIATVFALWCLPQIFFYGIYTVIAQVLNARDVFIGPMFAPIINNVIVIVTALIFLSFYSSAPTTDSISSFGLVLLGAGTTLGVIVQALILIPSLNKHGYGFNPRFKLAGLGQVGDLALWTIGFVAVNQISFAIIARLTTYANVLATQEGIAATGFTSYQKGQLMMMLPHSIITVSLITALLPRLSKQSHSGDMHTFGADLIHALKLVLALITPSAALLFITGPRLGVLLYGRGASTVDQGWSLGFVASMFALALPAFSVYYLLLRSYYAQENTKTPFMINVGLNVLHVGVALVMFWLAPTNAKVAVLGVAYAIAYSVTAVLTWYRVSNRLPELAMSKLARHIVRTTLASLVAMIVASLAHIALRSVANLDHFLMQILDLAVTASIFFAIYYFLATAMRITEVSTLTSFFNRRNAQ